MSASELILPAYAKLNLFLEVTGKRKDGYHTLETVMTSVSLCDTVSVRIRETQETPRITVACPGSTLSCGRDNLAWRAADAFLRGTGMALAIDITIQKRIPQQAGLGGGSSDAAAVLNALNALCNHPLCQADLLNAALTLGADVPYCVVRGTKLCRGIGEVMRDLPPLPPCHLVIAMGNGSAMPTPEAYRALDAYSFHPLDSAEILRPIREQNVDGIASALFNRFETVLPPDPVIARTLYSAGASGVLLTGSGAAVFGILPGEEQAENAVRVLSDKGFFAYHATPVSL